MHRQQRCGTVKTTAVAILKDFKDYPFFIRFGTDKTNSIPNLHAASFVKTLVSIT